MMDRNLDEVPNKNFVLNPVLSHCRIFHHPSRRLEFEGFSPSVSDRNIPCPSSSFILEPRPHITRMFWAHSWPIFKVILLEQGALIKKVAKDSSPQTGDRIEVIFLIFAASFGSLFRTFLKGSLMQSIQWW